MTTGAAVRPNAATRKRRPPYRGFAHTVWWFVLPAAALYIFAVVYPSIRGGLYAFTDWDGVSLNPNWVGLKQFARAFTDPKSLAAVRNTLMIAFGVMFVQNAIALLIALAVNSRIKSRNVLRVVIFAPVVITSIAVGFLWQNLYAPSGGLNEVLTGMGLSGLRQNWLGNPQLVLVSIMVVMIWQFVGYSMVIFLAGLQGIPEEVLEAAAIDGAGPVRRFWFIVRPLLAPAITINLMLSLIGGLKVFDQVFVMTAGGPGGASETISTLIYSNAFSLGRFGYASALAVVLTFFVALASIIQHRLLALQER